MTDTQIPPAELLAFPNVERLDGTRLHDFARAYTPSSLPAVKGERQAEADAITTLFKRYLAEGSFDVSAEVPPGSGQRVGIRVAPYTPPGNRDDAEARAREDVACRFVGVSYSPADLAIAQRAACAVVPSYGDGAPGEQEAAKAGKLWNDHPAVQGALRALHEARMELQALDHSGDDYGFPGDPLLPDDAEHGMSDHRRDPKPAPSQPVDRANDEQRAAHWTPRVGEEIRTTDAVNEKYGEWRNVRLWVAEVRAERGRNDRLNITVTEEWPMGRQATLTDGFYIGGDAPDDLQPAFASPVAGGEVEQLREALTNVERRMRVLLNENAEVLTVTVEHHVEAARDIARGAVSREPRL